MPKYCTRCGRPLEEGEICTCQQTAAAAAPQTAVAEPAQPDSTDAIPQKPGTDAGYESPTPASTGAYDAQGRAPYQEQYGMPRQTPPAYGAPQTPPPYGAQTPTYGAPQTPPSYGPAQGQQAPPPYPGQMPLPPMPPRRPGKVGVFFHNVGSLIGAFFKKPVDMVQAATRHEDMGIGFFFAGVNALFVALFFGIIFSQVGSLVDHLIGGMGSMFGYGGFSLPFLPFFLSGLVMAILGYFLLCGLTFLVGKIGKGQVSLKGTFAAMGVSTFPVTLCMALAILLAFLIPDWSIYVAIFALFVWVMCSYQASRVCAKVEDNKLYFLYPLAFLIMFLITAFISMKMLGWAMTQIQMINSSLW
ncbi:YIP1 family protein [Zongyangia hominis]|uniref:Yip1 domain-containing protein n=1 Tax=Zongyangia hominis TaxID=2763677 RepID=A0A926IBV5_9FIRM|nr:YIP1 family protein [Zongyangia hominis]MBC8570465.1 hypothetical protein [Zongyangia hominis]